MLFEAFIKIVRVGKSYSIGRFVDRDMRTSKNLIEDLSFGVFTIILFVVCWVQVGKAAEETQVMPHLVIVLGLACTIGMHRLFPVGPGQVPVGENFKMFNTGF